MSAALIARCQGRWREVLIAVGIPASALTGKHAACPACGGKDRFRFDDKDGSGSWFCNQCPRRAGYGIHLPQQVFGWTYAETCEAIEEVLVSAGNDVHRNDGRAAPSETLLIGDKSPADPLLTGKAIWESSQRINHGNATGAYLARRGLSDVADVLWLRHGNRVLYLDENGEFCGRFPAMLAVVRAPRGNVVALHRTFLTSSGMKADVPSPRKVLGSLIEGAAVRLSDHGSTLGIAEGIETALSASALFAVPCWAALTANGLAKWSPPDTVREVIIFGDNDAKFTGQQAAFTLAHRLACRGLAVRIEIPPSVGDDWNDVLRKGGPA